MLLCGGERLGCPNRVGWPCATPHCSYRVRSLTDVEWVKISIWHIETAGGSRTLCGLSASQSSEHTQIVEPFEVTCELCITIIVGTMGEEER